MSSTEPFAPRQFNPNEVLVPPAARESFQQLSSLGGMTLWLCAGFSLGHGLILWNTDEATTWLTVTGMLTTAVWQPILGSMLVLRDMGEMISRRCQRWLSLMSWAVFAWAILMVLLAGGVGFGTARIYQKQTEDHGVATTNRSNELRRLRVMLKDATEPAEMKRMVELKGITLPNDEPLPEAPRVLREKLYTLIGGYEEASDEKDLTRLDAQHAHILFSGLGRFFGALAAATVAFAFWAKSGWIRMIGD